MKKMMMIAAGVVLAGMTQAATINWTSGNFAVTWLSTGLTATSAGTQYYLVLNSYQSSITAAILDGTFSVATAGVLELALSTNAKGLVASHAANSSLLELDGTVYGFSVLVFDTVGGLDYYQFSSVQLSRAYTAGHPTYGEITTVTFGASHFDMDNWTPIPEPTSVALLAIGVAALGLRRKLRK